MGRWSKQGCINSAREYNCLKTWIRERKTAYLAARDNGWLDECCEHMVIKTPKKEWSSDKSKASARKHSNKVSWETHSGDACSYAIRNDGLDECCAHLKEIKHSVTKQDCINSAMPFSRIEDFYKHENFYFRCAREQGWLPEIREHFMKRKMKAWFDIKFGDADG